MIWLQPPPLHIGFPNPGLLPCGFLRHQRETLAVALERMVAFIGGTGGGCRKLLYTT